MIINRVQRVGPLVQTNDPLSNRSACTLQVDGPYLSPDDRRQRQADEHERRADQNQDREDHHHVHPGTAVKLSGILRIPRVTQRVAQQCTDPGDRGRRQAENGHGMTEESPGRQSHVRRQVHVWKDEQAVGDDSAENEEE